MYDDLLQETTRRALRYLRALPEATVAPSRQAVGGLDAVDVPLPDGPTDPRKTMALLDDAAAPATVASAGPRYFGFVTGGVVPAALAANWLAGAWDQNAALSVMSPAAARVERVALRWVRELLGLPEGIRGQFVTGTTMGSFVGLAAARFAVLRDVGWDLHGDGLFGAPEVRVVVGEEAHASLLRALGLLGFGRERLQRVPVDEQGRMRPGALPDLGGEPTILCIQAGNVNSGAFDPAAELCARAREAGAWVHVDGAFGLWARACPRTAGLAAGVELADSWATDGHKWLNVPYDSGMVFVRDAEALAGAMAMRAAYLPPGDSTDPLYTTPEGSRRARGIETWAALHSLGRSGVADLIDRCCRLARRFAAGLRGAGHEVLNDVVLNQVVVSFGGADATRRVLDAVQVDGTCWAGATEWRGRTAMRISVSGWSTTEEDVDRSLGAILGVAAAAGRGASSGPGSRR